MDVFQHQDIARRNTTLLVVLFAVAVLTLVSAVTFLVALFTGLIYPAYTDPQYTASTDWSFDWTMMLAVAGMSTSVIALAVLYKWAVLRPGGHVIAEQLGGRRLEPDSRAPLERKVLNVVEEMALAANMPVPPVYLLDNEPGINAFAAGYKPQDAVIGITRGCAEKLTRQQLQGVVAHEIAHIINGDMRLNIRIIAILNGILFISHAGYLLLRAGAFSGARNRNSKSNAAIPMLGLGLLVVGAVGVLFGNIIKAAVSRQREFLADASGAQFTREPDALAGALQQIGVVQQGSKVEDSHADENAHLFFGQAVSRWTALMATHPPLEERIRRLSPHWDGEFKANPAQALTIDNEATDNDAAAAKPSNRERLQQLSQLMLPALLIEDARDSNHSRALIFSLLLNEQPLAFRHQQRLITEQYSTELTERTLAQQQALQSLRPAQRLALVELAMPALKVMNNKARSHFISTVTELIHADGNVRLFDWCLQQLVVNHLQTDTKPTAKPSGIKQQKNHDAALSMSVLAQFGHSNEQTRQQAFAAGVSAWQGELTWQQPDVQQLSQALRRIDHWRPLEKGRLIKAWVACANSDKQLTETEHQLLITLCSCIGEPLPELPSAQ